MLFEFDERAFLHSRRSVLSSFRHVSWRVHTDRLGTFSFQCSVHSKGRKLLRRCRQQNCRSRVSGWPAGGLQSSPRPRSPMLLSARLFSATSCVSSIPLTCKSTFVASPSARAFIDQVLDE